MTIRISENYLGQILVGDLNRSLGHMLDLQRMAGSMRRINDFADDPRAVGSMQRYRSLIETNSQYIRNISRSQVVVDSTDTAMQDMLDLMSQARELILRESSALGTPESHTNAVIEVENLTNRLMDVLNTSVEGNYIFSGHKTSTPPFVRNGSTVVYQGDDGVITTQAGPNTTVPVNLPGSDFMGTQSAVLPGGADIAPSLNGTELLADINLGSGWEAGSIEIRDGNNSVWTVDLSSASTVNDVLATIGTATGGAVTATINGDGTGITLNGTGPLTVTEVSGGQTATSLGLNATSAAGILEGRDIRTAIATTTPLTDIPSLAGQLPLGSIEVEIDGTTYTVDFSAATTLGDLKTAYEAAVPGHELRLETSSLSIISGSSTSFVVRNVGATNTASLLGLEGTGTPVRIFGFLEDLRASLAADDKDSIRGAMTELAALEKMIQGQLIKVGGRENDLNWADGILRQRDEQLRSKLSLERDADVAQVSADLAQAETSYQSSLMVTSRLYQANLMMYL